MDWGQKVAGVPYIGGYIDGTSIRLKYKPQEAPQDYFCRKCNEWMNLKLC